MGDDTDGGRRGAWMVAAIAVGSAVAVAGLVYSVLAIPLYVFAQVDPDGLDRPTIRRAFFQVALPAGIVAGVVVGAVVGRWYARGGRLPDEGGR